MIKLHLTILLLLISSFLFTQNKDSLNIGDIAPSFSALNQDSTLIYSDSLLKEGKLVVVFYRGNWCPVCQRYLSDLQDSLMLIKATETNIVVITPEKPDSYQKTIKKTKAEYSVLFDKGYEIMNSYNVSYKISKETVPRYFPFVKKLTRMANENKEDILPIPATYVINQDGKIVYKHYDEDYRNRSSVKEILTYL
jgi:peroxiredoxin